MYHIAPSPSSASFNSDVGFVQRALIAEALEASPQNEQHLEVVDSDSENSDQDEIRSSIKSGKMRMSFSSSRSQLSITQEEEISSEQEEVDIQSFLDLPGLPNLPDGFISIPATENTPLLSVTPPSIESKHHHQTLARGELNTLLGYTLPIFGTHILELSLTITTVFSVGHIGKVELAAASLSSITANVFALSVIQGFCTALDTLCPQAYTSRPKETSLHALRTALILAFLMFPMFGVLWNAERLLLSIGQDPAVSAKSGIYLKIISFGLPGYAGFECVRRWLQAQGIMFAPTLSLFVAAPLNVILNYLFVWGPDAIRIGFPGAPLSTAISMNVMFLTSLCYAYFLAPKNAWGGFSWRIFQDLSVNINLGLAGWLLVGSEWISWEIVGLAASFLGPTTLAAQSILLSSASIFYQIPYSLSVAAAVRVGNLLGAGNPELARIASRVTLGIAVAIGVVNSVMLIVCRNLWGHLFSSDQEVIDLVARVLPLVALFQLTDSISGATGGLLRGAGKAPLGALINLISYYVVGLPIGVTVAFIGPKLGLFGLWLGLTLALTSTATLTLYFILRMNWQKCADKARARMNLSKRDEDDF